MFFMHNHIFMHNYINRPFIINFILKRTTYVFDVFSFNDIKYIQIYFEIHLKNGCNHIYTILDHNQYCISNQCITNRRNLT